ncbi:MAG: hypothetical protein DI533_00665 [Cereibacter sphaeroides]|uniref:DUF1622 domain-containing protein n=1 Tax=Cereibacter sphaeroides TaxID=1063 RepID=A0A2W5UT10_CERSP|nr:MAG: hypothetical protein DI533_00665 [Cereibacter sphaeroides]
MTVNDLIGHGRESLLDARFPGLVEVLGWVEAGIDLLAIAIMLIGVGRFVMDFAATLSVGEARGAGIDKARVDLGRYILAGLELLIVSDIMSTALSLQMADLVFLGLLVVIRSVISYFLGREIEGLQREVRGPDIDPESHRG